MIEKDDEKVVIPFVLGVSGRMDLPENDEAKLKSAFLGVLAWVRGQGEHGALGRGLGYGEGPILLLTSLAPGVDQLVAGWALEAGCQVKGALPFPADLYRQCSTFVRGNEKDDERQADFDWWRKELGEDGVFPVWRAKDAELKPEERRARQEEEVHDRVARNARYRAAGEYVSSYCDLLLAFTGGAEAGLAVPQESEGLREEYQSGTDWIVRSHLQGRLPGVLPIQATLNSADNGAVIRIWTRRTEEDEGGRVGEVEMFAPQDYPEFDADFQTMAEMEKARLLAHVNGLRGFSHEVERLRKRDFKKAKVFDDGAEQLKKVFCEVGNSAYHPGRKGQKAQKGSDATAALLGRLPRLKETVVMRRWAAMVNRGLDTEVKLVKKHLFILASVVVALGLLTTGLSWIAIRNGDWTFTIITTFLGLMIVGGGWRYYLRARDKRQIFDRLNDSRALAEALRVQMYWMAAGTGQSVASRYLQRARGTVSWIRAGVSCRAFPYEESKEVFQKLSPEEKLEVLRVIRNGWICEQEEYFGKKAHEFQQKEFRLKAVAIILTWAGVTMTLLARSGIEMASLWPLLLWMVALFGLVWEVRIRFSQGWKADDLPRDEDGKFQRFWAKVYKRALGNPVLLPLAFGVGLAFSLRFAICAVGPDWFSVPAWTLLVRNVSFAASGLTVSWIGLMFLNENSRRYSAMGKVFTGARRRLDFWLRKLELERGQPKDFEKTLAKCDLLITELGCEAIHENLDWLQMHRRKPIQPVFPN